jgi:hypothetical protein
MVGVRETSFPQPSLHRGHAAFYNVSYNISFVVTLMSALLLYAVRRSPVKIHGGFGGTYCFRFQGWPIIFCLFLHGFSFDLKPPKMEALCSTETSAGMYRTTWRDIPEKILPLTWIFQSLNGVYWMLRTYDLYSKHFEITENSFCFHNVYYGARNSRFQVFLIRKCLGMKRLCFLVY